MTEPHLLTYFAAKVKRKEFSDEYNPVKWWSTRNAETLIFQGSNINECASH